MKRYTGRVTVYDPSTGIGQIGEVDSRGWIYLHKATSDSQIFYVGDKVEFELFENETGLVALKVKRLLSSGPQHVSITTDKIVADLKKSKEDL